MTETIKNQGRILASPRPSIFDIASHFQYCDRRSDLSGLIAAASGRACRRIRVC
jgi:hypothetical protein